MPRFEREKKPGPAMYYIATPVRDFMPIFVLPALAEQAIIQLGRAVNDENAAVFGYCLMPSSLQAIIGFRDTHDLGSFLYHYKWLVSHAIICLDLGQYSERLYRKGKFKPWMKRFDHAIINDKGQFEDKLKYIHNEPVRKSLVKSEFQWPYSSAGDWFDGKTGIIEITKDITFIISD